jgi:hypothetical protein
MQKKFQDNGYAIDRIESRKNKARTEEGNLPDLQMFSTATTKTGRRVAKT